MIVVIAVEIGAGAVLRGVPPVANATAAIRGALPAAIRDALEEVDSDEVEDLAEASGDVPGLGIPYMAVLDSIVLFTIGLVASSLVIGDRVQGRVQGCATLILSIIVILATIALIIAAIVLLLLMIALLLATPFGTIAYLAIYGFFNRGGASAVLAVLMLLKLGFAVCLVVAQQRFLQNRGLVLLVLSSLVANIVLSFLHGLVPQFLVSITDAIGAIIVAACGCVWWILALIFALPAILKTIRARA
jgi:hypothetical protein